MTVHVLDTSAVFLLLNKHRPPLLTTLNTANSAEPVEGIFTPAVVLIEVGQAKEPPKKRLEAILELAPPVELTMRIAERTAEGLRRVKRDKCGKCSGFVRPTLVDAAVMALAAEYAENEDAIVYTQDVGDLELLRDAIFTKVKIVPVG